MISRQATIEALDMKNYATIYVWASTSEEEQTAIAELVDYVVDQTLESATKAIEALPDAVVRCKDCKWFRKEYGWNCIEFTVCGISPTHHPIRREEDFCSKAERRDG